MRIGVFFAMAQRRQGPLSIISVSLFVVGFVEGHAKISWGIISCEAL